MTTSSMSILDWYIANKVSGIRDQPMCEEYLSMMVGHRGEKERMYHSEYMHVYIPPMDQERLG